MSDKTSFALQTKDDQLIEAMKEANERIKHWPENHVQVKAEKNFYKLKEYEKHKYVLGSAGFAGFAVGSFSLAKLEKFSQQKNEIIGEDWSKWGTEQVASKFLIANSSPSTMMPFPKYAGYYPPLNISYENTHFVHFVGYHRWRYGF